MVQGIKDYSMWNISNQINLRRGQTSTLSIRFPIFFSLAMHHVSLYFLGKGVSRFLPRVKRSCFRKKKIPSFQIIQQRSCAGAAPFGKTIFSKGLKKISYFRVFFKKRSSFIFRLTCKIIFSGKRISSFPIIQERSYSTAIFF